VDEAHRAAEAQRQLRRARAALGLPTVVLPLLPGAPWGPDEVEQLASALAQGGMEVGR
jgi:hypothetical protein